MGLEEFRKIASFEGLKQAAFAYAYRTTESGMYTVGYNDFDNLVLPGR